MDKERPRAAIACRISKKANETDTLGVSRQEHECRKLAKALEVDVVAVYVDNNRSAYSGVQREDYEALVRSVENGELDYVLAFHPDRLHRDIDEHEQWIKLIRRTKVRIVTLLAGERDLTKASDRMIARYLAAAAAYESELKAERQQAKIRQLAAAGRPMNGPRPYGWKSATRKEPVVKEQKVIREMADRILAGASQGDVVRWTKAKKILTAQKKQWTVSRVRKLLLSPGIAGLRVYQDLDPETAEPVTVTVKATWKGIITVEERERIQAILGQLQRHRSPSAYLLSSGLLVCDSCGTPHVGAGRRDYRRYRCAQLGTMVARQENGCGRTSHKADTLEEHVVEFALWWATSPEVISSRRTEREKASAETEKVRRQLRELTAKEQRLTDLRVDGDISPQEYRRKKGELTTKRQQLEGNLLKVESAEARLTGGGAAGIRDRWNDLTHNEKRTVLRSLLAEVRLKPGLKGRNTFDPDRVLFRPQWSGPAHLERELGALTAADWREEERRQLADGWEDLQQMLGPESVTN